MPSNRRYVKRGGFIVDTETGECMEEVYFEEHIDKTYENINNERKTKTPIFSKEKRRLGMIDRSISDYGERTSLRQKIYFNTFMKSLDLPEGIKGKIYYIVFHRSLPINLYETITRTYDAIIQTNAPVLNKTFIDAIKELFPQKKHEILKRVNFLNRDYLWICREMLDNIEWVENKPELESKICQNFAILSTHFDNKLKLMGVLTRLTLLRMIPKGLSMPDFSVFNLSSATYYTYIKKLKKLGVIIYD